jgi:hypothetical protein
MKINENCDDNNAKKSDTLDKFSTSIHPKPSSMIIKSQLDGVNEVSANLIASADMNFWNPDARDTGKLISAS